PESRNALKEHLASKGVAKDQIEACGLVRHGDDIAVSYDWFRDRVMFPIHNIAGKVVAFAGRILQKDVKAPKYINSPETEIYNKSKTLYGAYFAKKAIQQLDECILVEGYTDVISLHQAGIENVVASSGTSLTVDQIRLVKRYTLNVILLYDGDSAGEKAAGRGVDMLLEEGLNVNIVLLPKGEDPDSFGKKVSVAEFRDYIRQNVKDLVYFKAALLLQNASSDPQKRVKMANEIINILGKVPDRSKREIYIRDCSKLTGISEQVLNDEVKKVVKQRFEIHIAKKELAPQSQQDIEIKGGAANPEDSDESKKATSDTLDDKLLASVSDEFQEKDIARILIASGGEIYDAEHHITIAEYIIMNIDDVIEEFDSKLYQKIVKETIQLLIEKLPVTPQYFIRHTDHAISQLAVNLLAFPFDYSENWEKRHDIYLSQKHPDQNFDKDSEQALFRFKLRKVIRMCERNLQELTALNNSEDTELIINHLKVQQKLNGMRNEIADKLKTVVLK
ncbi:MAG: DNA primase, partial [Saprospiraceae bacterium]